MVSDKFLELIKIFRLLRSSRSFRWLNATQFLGALNDNLFKLLVSIFLIGIASAPRAPLTVTGACMTTKLLILTLILIMAAAGVQAYQVEVPVPDTTRHQSN